MPPSTTLQRPRRSLSVRLLMLVVTLLFSVEGLIFLAGIPRERSHWLVETLRDTQIAALALGGDLAGPVAPAVRADLLRLSGAEMIRLLLPDGTTTVLAPPDLHMPKAIIDLDDETWLQGFGRALDGLVRHGSRRLELIGTGPLGTRLDLLVPERNLSRYLRRYALRFLTISVIIAVVTGGLLFVALRALLVLPLRRITDNIITFRTDPEQSPPLDAERISPVHDDEITTVGRELSAMQAELRTALWRNARLAAVGTAVAKMSHDLRGTLSSALLVADRLTMSREPQVQQAGNVIVGAVHRATALAQQTLSFVREGPPPLARAAASLHGMIAEAANVACEQNRLCTVRQQVDTTAELNVDRESILRVLTNLFRNAAQAGARIIDVTATGEDAATTLRIRDDGPGLPDSVRATLFRPFVTSNSGGSGLGLAIARDLMRAHGGDLELHESTRTGTTFLLHFQQPKREGD